MKNLFLFSLLFINILLISCERRIVDDIPHLHQLYIKFVDQKGENVLKDVPIEKLKNNIEVLADEDGNKILYSIKYVKYEEKEYLYIQASSMPGVFLEEINYTIKSKEIFGDEAVHTIKSMWVKNNNNALSKTVSIDEQVLQQEKINEFLRLYTFRTK